MYSNLSHFFQVWKQSVWESSDHPWYDDYDPMDDDFDQDLEEYLNYLEAQRYDGCNVDVAEELPLDVQKYLRILDTNVVALRLPRSFFL